MGLTYTEIKTEIRISFSKLSEVEVQEIFQIWLLSKCGQELFEKNLVHIYIYRTLQVWIETHLSLV